MSSATPQPMRGAVTFEPAPRLELEPGSYGKSQRDRYNQIYGDPAAHTSQPNAFLLECLDQIEQDQRQADAGATSASIDRSDKRPRAEPHIQRAALDIAMGEGRNTIALAQRGYRAVGFDMADVGVNIARQRAAELGVTIDGRVQTFNEFDFGAQQWDVAVMMYFSVDDNDMKRIAEAIKPGGYFIIERSGGDIRNDFLRQLPASEWNILHFTQDFGPRDWASKTGNPGPGLRTQVFARKRLH
jgi:SAM-dependent methyltransferase